jgi:hypothetical protein
MDREFLESPALNQLAAHIVWDKDDRDVVYHGTCFGRTIGNANALIAGLRGNPFISLTRSPHIAAYWSLMRVPGDDGFGTVLTLDRTLLTQRYHLGPASNMPSVDERQCDDETEERIQDQDVTDLTSCLLSRSDIQDRYIWRRDFRDEAPISATPCLNELDFPPGFWVEVKHVAVQTVMDMFPLISVCNAPRKPTVTFRVDHNTLDRLAALERLVGYLQISR